MATPYRKYTEIPGSAVPDVPFRVNAILREIDADVQRLSIGQRLDPVPADQAVAQYLTTTGTESEIAVRDLVEGSIANDPSVIAAAAGLAQSDEGLARITDPLIPVSEAGWIVSGTTRDFVRVTVDNAGRISNGTLEDGSEYIARLAQGDFVTQEHDGDYTVLRGTMDAEGRFADDAIGRDGRFLPQTIESIRRRLAESEPVSSPPLDVIVIAGQSNSMANPVDVLPGGVEPPPADPRILVWDNGANSVGTLDPASATSQTMGAAFAREYVRTLDPARSILLVFNGVGSSGFTTTSLASPPAGYYTGGGGTWDRTLTADPVNFYNRMVNEVNLVMTKVPAGSAIKAFLWSQGEADTNAGTGLSKEQYAAKFDDLVSSARTAWSAANMRVVVGSMVPEWVDATPLAAPVQAALEDSPRRIPLSAYAPGPDNLTDTNYNIHWSAQGMAARGPIFHHAYHRAKYNLAGVEAQPPQHVRARRSGTTLIVEWEHPPSPASSFTVQYRVNGGAWTAAALTDPLARIAKITGIAPDAQADIRARTVNTTSTSNYTKELSA